MDYEPKIIPEGINTSREHPLRELVVLVSGLALVIFVVTGLLAVSTDFLVQYIPLEKENDWFATEKLTDAEVPELGNDTMLEAEVERYLRQLILKLQDKEKTGYRFSLSLLRNEVPNAFVVPGGQIFVTSGLLEAVASENGLAMVLAHEMSHQYYRHPLRSLGRGVVLSLVLMVVSGVESDGLVESFVGNTAMLTSLSFSREQEREADRLGLDLLMRHYGHASGSSEFFEAMLEHSQADSEPPEFLSTHPGVEERLDLLRKFSGQASGDVTPLPEVIGRYLESIGNG